MTGRIIHTPEQAHDCKPGSIRITHLPRGGYSAKPNPAPWSVWRCDHCRDTWTYWPSASGNASGGWIRDLPDPGIKEGQPLWPWFYVMCAVIIGLPVLLVAVTW